MAQLARGSCPRPRACAVDVRTLDDAALVAHLDSVIDLLREGQIVHFRLFLPYVTALYELGAACEELLGWSPARAVTLLSGTSAVSSEPGRALARLAKTISDSAGSAAIVRESSSEAFERLRSAEAGSPKAIDDYLDRYGYRPMSYDPGDVTLAERPVCSSGCSVTSSIAASRRRTSTLDAERQALSPKPGQDSPPRPRTSANGSRQLWRSPATPTRSTRTTSSSSTGYPAG